MSFYYNEENRSSIVDDGGDPRTTQADGFHICPSHKQLQYPATNAWNREPTIRHSDSIPASRKIIINQLVITHK